MAEQGASLVNLFMDYYIFPKAGEMPENGDECLAHGHWVGLTARDLRGPIPKDYIVRRRVTIDNEPRDWNVNPPDPKQPVLWWNTTYNFWQGALEARSVYHATKWLPVPPAPPTKEPWKIAWEAQGVGVLTVATKAEQSYFRAGFEAARKDVK